ncbi:hypothetical protein RJ639_008525 [Escallonia herrerae]|uniref:Reverse transcriptase Ty1/copia-type domain-containing protein n=1 Tax=Escallonia herrerae TaxID=1293975 RepID=A0AA88VNK8_9ASTE|nr:hypothetical protein RJ639_008525 [Escallonia herrerae]
MGALDSLGYGFSAQGGVLKVTKGITVVMKGQKLHNLYRMGGLDYVHSDVWGPSLVSSQGGACYFVSFIDDYSIKLWDPVAKKRIVSCDVVFDKYSRMIRQNAKNPEVVQNCGKTMEVEIDDHRSQEVVQQSMEDPQPEGFIEPGKENYVCKLRKLLYGLKQSPRQWYKLFDSFMVAHGYTRCEYDCCVYLKALVDVSHIFLTLYVDDLLIAEKSKLEIAQLKTLLSAEFEMKDLRAAKKILGMEISRDRQFKKLWITQKKYIQKVLERSVLQSTSALSTTKAEYMAVTEASKEALWLKGLVEELSFKQGGILLHCNSQSAIHLAKNQVYHARTKHIDVRYHRIREWINSGEINLSKIHTQRKRSGHADEAGNNKQVQALLGLDQSLLRLTDHLRAWGWTSLQMSI